MTSWFRGVLQGVYVSMEDLEASSLRRSRPDWGCSATEKKMVVSDVTKSRYSLLPLP
jgi:hypothetical protein